MTVNKCVKVRAVSIPDIVNAHRLSHDEVQLSEHLLVQRRPVVQFLCQAISGTAARNLSNFMS